MKPILKTTNKLSFSIKLTLFVVSVIATVSFFLSLKYSGNNKKEFPELVVSAQLTSPQCSCNGGWYTDNVLIKLTSTDPNLKIYYTLDGSVPTLKSSTYDQPIVIQNRTAELNNLSDIPTSSRWKPPVDNVFKGTVLRAIAVSIDNKKSKELVRTFFVDERGASKYSLPTIELTVNVEDFFGYKKGIYVLGKNYEDKSDYIRKNISLDLPWWEYPSNYLKRGDNSERPVHIEFYEPDGKLGFENDVGIRINGNATRGFAQKSLRVCFDKKYGAEELNYKLFPDYNITKFNSFILRNSGNDWNKTMFRDAFMQSLMINSKLDIQAYRPAIVFINGEYWGVHNIRERFDENYIANKYAINKDSIVILELGGDLSYGIKQDVKDFRALLDFIKTHDLSQEANYSYVKTQVDFESLLDFIIANVYFCNSDWPNNNVKFWRYRKNEMANDSVGVKDGRWRWMLYDTDWGFGYTGKDASQLNLLQKATETGSIGVIFEGLLKNKEFVDVFVKRFQFHLANTFNKDAVIKKINQFQAILNPEMNEHINRWRVIGSYSNWNDYVEELRIFAIKRPDMQFQQLEKFIETNKKIN
jgi:hypothetical protein